MSEETDAPQGGTEATAIAETSQVDAAETQSADDTAAQDTGTEESGQADETGEPAKKKPWWEKRFDELTAQKYEAANEAAYWRGIAEGKTPQAPVQEQQGPPDRWDDPEGYDRWLINQAKVEFREEQKASKVAGSYLERVAKFAESKPDYDRVVNNPALKISPVMAEVIGESELGPEVAYHLGSNPSEAARIASLPHARQAAEIGRLEAKLAQPAAKPQPRTPPPPPPQTVNGLSSGLNKAPEDMTMAEYIAWRSKD